MRKPKEEEERAPLYLVKPRQGEWFGVAGLYIGETDSHVVIRIGDSIKGFPWQDVDPIAVANVKS